MKTRTFLFASLFAISLTVMACGSKTEEQAPMDTAATTTTPAPSAPTTDTMSTTPAPAPMDTAAHSGMDTASHSADTTHK